MKRVVVGIRERRETQRGAIRTRGPRFAYTGKLVLPAAGIKPGRQIPAPPFGPAACCNSAHGAAAVETAVRLRSS